MALNAKGNMAVQWIAMDNARKSANTERILCNDDMKKAAESYLANAGEMSPQAKDAYSKAMSEGDAYLATGLAHKAAGDSRVTLGDQMQALGDAYYAAQDYPAAVLAYDNWGSYNNQTLGAKQHYWFATNDFTAALNQLQLARQKYQFAYSYTIP